MRPPHQHDNACMSLSRSGYRGRSWLNSFGPPVGTGLAAGRTNERTITKNKAQKRRPGRLRPASRRRRLCRSNGDWRPCAAGQQQGHHAKNERHRGHENRPEPQPCCFDRGVLQRESVRIALIGKPTIRMAFFAASPDEGDQADLEINVVDIPNSHTAVSAPNTPNGTAKMTAKGTLQPRIARPVLETPSAA